MAAVEPARQTEHYGYNRYLLRGYGYGRVVLIGIKKTLHKTRSPCTKLHKARPRANATARPAAQKTALPRKAGRSLLLG